MDDMTDSESRFARPEVAVAVVTSHLGVLVGRRRDGSPPWTFPGGKIEPGESPEDAAVRETLEETGLQVRGTRIIGSRVHPQTGVPIVYVAAALAGGVEAEIRLAVADFESRDERELTEVRWVCLEEARALMDGMADPVQRYLQRVLGG
jgi:8-oxo-dGTP diphosphatase